MGKFSRVLDTICFAVWGTDLVRHIGHMAGATGQFFEQGVSDVAILCSLIICMLHFTQGMIGGEK